MLPSHPPPQAFQCHPPPPDVPPLRLALDQCSFSSATAVTRPPIPCRSDSDKHEYAVTASFVEIYQEEIRDLLADRSALAPAVVVREMPSGGVCLSGATEVPVSGIEDMVACVERGTLCRATSATGMNRRSSRSHAIFTISLEKRRREEGGTGVAEDEGEIDDADYVCAKVGLEAAEDEGEIDETPNEARWHGVSMHWCGGRQGTAPCLGCGRHVTAFTTSGMTCAQMHLVDLAGSERAKRTKAEGQRLKEGIHINRGLLALSNVISALCDETR